jgi:hypothetical protein
LTGTFTLTLSGGGLAAPTNATLIFSGTTFTTNAPSVVTGGKIDATGKLTVMFLDGLPSKHKTTAIGTVLQNANSGAGFFIRGTTTTPTNSGSLLLTP